MMGTGRTLSLATALAIIGLTAGCSEVSEKRPQAVRGTDDVPAPVDPRPEKLDGSESREFETDDIEAAEHASSEVQEYCAGAVSEAQYEGCLSHVTEAP